MTEEEYFRKNYPDSCYGDKLLSPHWDFFQDGVGFGERQSEKKIEELEGRLKEHESVGNAQFWENVWSWKTKSDQLIKAKDIMKRLVDLSNSSRSLLGGTWHETVREAEDFLKEDSISEHIQRATHNYM